jgi:GrpB-like predicted nucleotidyltransferase (UPF0157 family)
LGDRALRIDHIGSTSVRGLAAKPIIDIQISVADFEPIKALTEPLKAIGYQWRSAKPGTNKALLPGAPRRR